MADLHKRLEKAEKYLQKGKQADALEEYLGILEDDPNQDAVRQTAADLSLALGRNTDAASLLSALFDRQAAANDQAKAIVNYKKLAKAGAPTTEQTYKYATFIEKNDKRAALDSYEVALKAFESAGKKNDALNALKRMVVLDPSPVNQKRTGEMAEACNDGKTAALCFVKMAEAEPQQAGVWYSRAYSQDSANSAAAIGFARSIVAADPAQAATIVASCATGEAATPEAKQVYLQALVGAKRYPEAEPLILAQLDAAPDRHEEASALLSSYLVAEQYERAVETSRKLEQVLHKHGKKRDFISLVKDISSKHPPGVQYLEYMVALYNSANREQDYCETLIALFQLYYAQGNYLKAADALDRCVEVDPYQEGNQQRLEMLRGKVDANRFNAIANRLTSVGAAGEEAQAESAAPEDEPTVLEDLILQAEIFLQYSMRTKALDRLQRVCKLFPHEEEKNEKLRNLYNNAGFFPKYEDSQSAPTGSAPAPLSPFGQAPTYAGRGQTGTMQVPPGGFGQQSAAADEKAVDNFSRVTEITRNIYRQSTVKGVLFAAVNDVGRHYNASRCVAGLISPGKPPSAALEYCAPNVKQSEVNHLVALLGAVQKLSTEVGTVALDNVNGASELSAVSASLAQLEIKSLLAAPLVDSATEDHVGILLLEQCDQARAWRQPDSVVLKTIADQMVLAVNNAKLRSLMKNLAVTDEKSGLLKRSSYIDVMLSEVERALSQKSTMSVLLFSFGKASALLKEVGEAGVENMMQHIGQTISSQVRQNDLAVRYDLSSVAVILPDTTDKNSFFVIEKMRKALADFRVGGGRPLEITVGIAEAVANPQYDAIDILTEVMNRAESALDAARADGPNSARSAAPQLMTGAVA